MTIYLQRGDKGTRGDGGKGDWIVAWQSFLAGQGIYVGDYSPNYGPKTEDATKRAQQAWSVEQHGKVEDATTKAAKLRGLSPLWVVDRPVDRSVEKSTTLANVVPGYMDPAYPQPVDLDGDGRADLVYGGESHQQKLWGPLTYRIYNGELIPVNDWYTKNIRSVEVPQLVGVDIYGTPSKGSVLFHRLAAPQLLGAFQEIEDRGLKARILTYGGSYNLRFIRGSTTTLSNHSFGVAFDINMEWGGLGKQPALVGQKGSVRDLAPIFERWGFFWGGWYRSRLDGMHFECVKRLPVAELTGKVMALKKNDHILPWLKEAA